MGSSSSRSELDTRDEYDERALSESFQEDGSPRVPNIRKGAKLFKRQCSRCHTTAPVRCSCKRNHKRTIHFRRQGAIEGPNKFRDFPAIEGPTLYHLFGRKALPDVDDIDVTSPLVLFTGRLFGGISLHCC